MFQECYEALLATSGVRHWREFVETIPMVEGGNLLEGFDEALLAKLLEIATKSSGIQGSIVEGYVLPST